MEKFFKNFDKIFASVAFAEAGEFETARNMFSSENKSHKNILLVTDGEEINQGAFKHAVKLCQRVGTGLEIFHKIDLKEEEITRSKSDLYIEKKERLQSIVNNFKSVGINLELITDSENFLDQLSEKIKNRCDIFCVILGTGRKSKSSKTNNYFLKRVHDAFKDYGYPMVVIS